MGYKKGNGVHFKQILIVLNSYKNDRIEMNPLLFIFIVTTVRFLSFFLLTLLYIYVFITYSYHINNLYFIHLLLIIDIDFRCILNWRNRWLKDHLHIYLLTPQDHTIEKCSFSLITQTCLLRVIRYIGSANYSTSRVNCVVWHMYQWFQ